LKGWPNGEAPSSSTQFGELNLPPEVHLSLSAPDLFIIGGNPRSASSTTNEERFFLKIHDEANDESHTISFPASKTIKGVKEEVFTLTDISVRHQSWSGWPEGSSDDMVGI